MSVIDERARLRRAAIQAELRAKFPGLFPKPKPAIPAIDRTAIALGRDERGRAILLPERPRLEHMHVIGTTGGGKSKFLEHCIRQDIIHGRGVCVIDPHGEHPDSLYREALSWLDASGYARKRVVHIIDPNAPSHTIGFNPLSLPDEDTDLSVVAGLTLDALSKAWGGEDTSAKPTIERVATTAFTVLADLQLTLVEAPLLLDRRDRHGLRAYALEHVRDRFALDELQRLHELSLDERRRHDFDIEIVGPINRLARFLRPSAIRAMVGQTERLLDFRQAFDEGHVILCSLSGGSRIYQKDADLLARLLSRFIFFHAKRRETKRPFILYLDECHRYLSADLEGLLAEVRKFGVAVVLSHQWQAQAAVESDNMLAAIRNATNVKVAFRIKDHKEAEDLAHMIVPLNLEMPVETLRRPTVVGHRRSWLANESTGTNRSRSTTQGLSVGDTHARGETIGVAYGETSSESVSDGWSIGESETEGRSLGTSLGESATHGSSLTTASSTGMNVSMGIVTMPTEQTLLPPPYPTVLSESYGVGFNTSESLGVGASSSRGVSSAVSEAKNRSRGRSSAVTSAQSRGVAHSSSVSHAESVMKARSTARSVSESESLGESQSRGVSESLEPILEVRPGSVHGKDNVLYMAAQTLRSLPTGHALLNYVGSTGMVASRLVVPLIKSFALPNDMFVALRERLLSESAATIPSTLAQALVDARENAFLKFTKRNTEALPEPESFRVPTRADAACRGDAGPVAGGRPVSGKEMLYALLDHATPLTDGGQEQAKPALGQGSRSPEATARRAALDGTQVRPKKARHAVKGKPRNSSKV